MILIYSLNLTLGNQSPRLGNLNSGTNRALLSWYNIDPVFYRNTNNTPRHIADDDIQLSNHNVREVLEKEVFPNRDPQYATQVSNLSVLTFTIIHQKEGLIILILKILPPQDYY